MSGIDRRLFLATSLAAAALSATGGSVRAADAALRVAWWGGKDRAERTEKTLALYSAAHAGTSFSTEYLGWGDYWARLTTETSGGNSPDVVQMSITYLADYASRGVLLDMLPLVPSPLDIKGFQADLVDNGKVDGKLFAIPCGVNVGAIVLDKALYDEAGVTPPGHDTTWEQFAGIMAEFAKKTKRKDVFGTPDSSGNGPLLETWLRQRGKKMYEADGSLGYDATDAGDWFAMWAEMRASGGAATAEVQALDHGDIDNNLLAQNRASLAFENSNQYVGMQALKTDPLVLAPYPKLGADGKGGLYLKPTMFWSISAQSKNPHAAAELVNFLISDPGAVATLGVERGIPASAEVRDALKPKLDAGDKVVLDYIDSLGDLLGELAIPAPPGGGEVDDALLNYSQQIAFGSMSPKDGGAVYIDAVHDILSRAG
jgi:multiple sugar transport system substrate-binding protein